MKTLRTTLLVGLAFACGAAFAQDLSAKFSFKAPAARAKSLVGSLGKAAGVSLSTSGNVGEDVLVLNLTDVTVAEAMKRIAETLHAEWQKDGEGYVLSRGSILDAQDRRAEAAFRPVPRQECPLGSCNWSRRRDPVRRCR